MTYIKTKTQNIKIPELLIECLSLLPGCCLNNLMKLSWRENPKLLHSPMNMFAISALKIRKGWGLLCISKLVWVMRQDIDVLRQTLCINGDSVHFKFIYLLHFKLFSYFKIIVFLALFLLCSFFLAIISGYMYSLNLYCPSLSSWLRWQDTYKKIFSLFKSHSYIADS